MPRACYGCGKIPLSAICNTCCLPASNVTINFSCSNYRLVNHILTSLRARLPLSRHSSRFLSNGISSHELFWWYILCIIVYLINRVRIIVMSKSYLKKLFFLLFWRHLLVSIVTNFFEFQQRINSNEGNHNSSEYKSTSRLLWQLGSFITFDRLSVVRRSISAHFQQMYLITGLPLRDFWRIIMPLRRAS